MEQIPLQRATEVEGATDPSGTEPSIRLDASGALAGECLFYFGPEPWEGLWRNRHQLMSRFARNNLVFYVEPRTALNKVVRGILSRKIPLRSLFAPSFSRTPEGVYLYHSPKWLPVTDKPLLRRLTDFGWRLLLERKAKRLGGGKPIVWLARPELVRYAGQFKAKKLIYHVVDEYLGYYGGSEEFRRQMVKDEKVLLQKSDLTIVVSRPLLEAKSPLGRRVEMVPNAVDFEAYSTAPPNGLPGIPGPVIGYSGLIGNRLDFGLLNRLAEAHPEWSFVLVGDVVRDHCEAEIEAFERRPNTYLPGRKGIDEIASVVRSFDVGIIPYKMDLQAANVSPLKMYEYMAAGLPIVTTDFSVAREFEEIIHVHGTPEGFDKALQECLAAGAEVRARVEAGRRLAGENTWEHRIREISALVAHPGP